MENTQADTCGAVRCSVYGDPSCTKTNKQFSFQATSCSDFTCTQDIPCTLPVAFNCTEIKNFKSYISCQKVLAVPLWIPGVISFVMGLVIFLIMVFILMFNGDALANQYQVKNYEPRSIQDILSYANEIDQSRLLIIAGEFEKEIGFFNNNHFQENILENHETFKRIGVNDENEIKVLMRSYFTSKYAAKPILTCGQTRDDDFPISVPRSLTKAKWIVIIDIIFAITSLGTLWATSWAAFCYPFLIAHFIFLLYWMYVNGETRFSIKLISFTLQSTYFMLILAVIIGFIQYYYYVINPNELVPEWVLIVGLYGIASFALQYGLVIGLETRLKRLHEARVIENAYKKWENNFFTPPQQLADVEQALNVS